MVTGIVSSISGLMGGTISLALAETPGGATGFTEFTQGVGTGQDPADVRRADARKKHAQQVFKQLMLLRLDLEAMKALSESSAIPVGAQQSDGAEDPALSETDGISGLAEPVSTVVGQGDVGQGTQDSIDLMLETVESLLSPMMPPEISGQLFGNTPDKTRDT